MNKTKIPQKSFPNFFLTLLRKLSEYCLFFDSVSDNHLFLFLHSNFYDTTATQEAIEVYYNLRTNSPELFKGKGILGPAISNVWTLT